MTRTKDVECPYCGHRQDINHGEGYGYTEDELHQQTCFECDKDFGFRTSVLYSYETQKVRCFNDADCEWVKSSRTTLEGVYDIQHWRCKHCDASRSKWLDVSE